MEGASKITIQIFKSVTLVHEGGMVLLEVGWKCSSKQEMHVDALAGLRLTLSLSSVGGQPTHRHVC